MQNSAEIKEKLSRILGPERYKHSESVEKETVKLAKKWGVAEEKASIAGLLHDCSRWMDSGQMLEKAKELNFTFGKVEILEPKLLHARLSRYFAQTDYKVNDKEVLTAIERHTLGAPGMSTLDKLVYLADHIEPDRDFGGIEEVRKMSYENLNRAIIISSSAKIRAILSKGLPIHPEAIDTRNFYLLNPEG